ncbi:phenazine biosynthesis protein PhzF [Subtercola sp. Z020]|uniref:PhzF family phenazine biosynthesis protein n=1 Tax=Subtercola sp. Z020 TaxID=2080582 RepID=UPI000CE8E3DF|nr:PhzF family phenazine biosynthesis protein [Subtercola sp. Z020]PPF89494.1 phenazine biosynthesis protein PhzF [Subtercola sp. Z020]
MRLRDFRQVDVFSATPYRGNPLAVVLDGRDVDDEALADFANWTNLSETTFVLPPSPEAAAAGADYHVRIFTPSRELPFAGHPTLGTAHAWLEAGNEPRDPAAVVQECGVGLVRIRREGERLAFAAPELLRSGPIDPADLAELTAVLGIAPADVVDANWVDNGPGWSGLLLPSAEAVLALEPDFAALGRRSIGVVGPYAAAAGADGDDSAAPDAADATAPATPHFEVRGFAGSAGVGEDPVTGSLNASLAQWLMAAGHAPDHYVAAQGTRLGRAGRVHLDRVDGQVWVGGASTTCIAGTVLL